MSENENLPAVLKPGDYAVFRAQDQDVQDVLAELQGVQIGDLDRVKIPSGGSLFFEIPSSEGPQAVNALRGIVIAHKDNRVFWSTPIEEREGGAKPPDCRSDDAVIGTGERWEGDEKAPHECARCPYSQFGSDGRGQRCKQVKLVFMLRPESFLPLVLVLSPTSIKATRQYLITRLAASGVSSMAVETEYKLEKAKNDDGIEYAKATPRAVRRLTPQEISSLGRLAVGLKKLFSTVRVRAEDVTYGPGGPAGTSQG